MYWGLQTNRDHKQCLWVIVIQSRKHLRANEITETLSEFNTAGNTSLQIPYEYVNYGLQCSHKSDNSIIF